GRHRGLARLPRRRGGRLTSRRSSSPLPERLVASGGRRAGHPGKGAPLVGREAARSRSGPQVRSVGGTGVLPPARLGARVYEVAHGRGSSPATGDAFGVAHALRVVARAGARGEISPGRCG